MNAYSSILTDHTEKVYGWVSDQDAVDDVKAVSRCLHYQ